MMILKSSAWSLTSSLQETREYIALLPMEGAESEEGEVYLYRYSETEDGTPVLDNIMDDDEYEIVADAFDEMLDDQEYDELVSEEDLDD